MGCLSRDSALHSFWLCPRNADIEDEAVQKTQHLVAAAARRAEELPCLWLRGILPQNLTITDPDNKYVPTEELVFHAVNPETSDWNSGVYYGDASGGEFTSYS